MPASTQATREYRAIVPMEGYVHKFRLEALEEAVAHAPQPELSTPTVAGACGYRGRGCARADLKRWLKAMAFGSRASRVGWLQG